MLRTISFFMARFSRIQLASCKMKPNIIQVFSDIEKKKIGLQAIWAESIYDEIRTFTKKDLNVTLLDHLHSCRLSDRISSYLEAARVTTEEIENSRKEVMAAFDEFKGVPLNEAVLSSQKQIQQAVNKSNGHMSFHPNSSVTSTLFQDIISKSHSCGRKLIIGKPGTSKTMSFILAQHILNLSTPFRFKYPQYTEWFINHQLLKLGEKFVKVVYINFKSEQIITDKLLIVQKVISQFPEISQNLKSVLLQQIPLYRLKQKIYSLFFTKNIRRVVVMDQIHVLADIFRQLNDMQRYGTKAKTQYQTLKKTAQKLTHIYKMLKSSPFLLISSKQIESELLQRPFNMNGVRFAFDLNYHDEIDVDYYGLVNIKGDIKTVQTYRSVWFELIRQLGLQNISVKVKQQAIKACDYWASSQKSSFVTLVAIKKFISQKLGASSVNDFIPIIQDQTGQKIKQFINSLISEIINKPLNQQKQRTINFLMDKNDTNRWLKLNIAVDCEYYLREHPDKISIPFSQINDKVRNQIEQWYDKDLFSVFPVKQKNLYRQNQKQKLEQKYLQLNYLPGEYHQIFNSWMELFVSDSSNIEDVQWFMDRMKCIRDLLLTCINKLLLESTKMRFQISLSTDLSQNNIKTEVQHFEKQNFIKYHHFQFNKENISKSLESVFEVVRSQNLKDTKYCFATVAFDDQAVGQTDPKFDLLAVKLGQNNKFQVTSFDFIADNKIQDINSKLDKATNLIKKIFVTSEYTLKSSNPSVMFQEPLVFLSNPRKTKQNWVNTIKKLKQKSKNDPQIGKIIEKIGWQTFYMNLTIQQSKLFIKTALKQLIQAGLISVKQRPNQSSTNCNVSKWTHVILCPTGNLQQDKLKELGQLEAKLKQIETNYQRTRVNFKFADLSKFKIETQDKKINQQNSNYKQMFNKILEKIK